MILESLTETVDRVLEQNQCSDCAAYLVEGACPHCTCPECGRVKDHLDWEKLRELRLDKLPESPCMRCLRDWRRMQ